MTSKERVLCALAGSTPDRVPFVEHQIDPPVLRALFGETLSKDPVYVAEQLGLDVLSFTMHPPLFVELEALPDGMVYQTSGRLHARADLSLLDGLRDPTDPKLYEGLEALVAGAGGRAVVGKSRLGLSAMMMSMDLAGFSFAMADDPEMVLAVLKRYLQWSEVAAREMSRRGADVLWFFDDIAHHSGPMMAPTVFREFLLPAVREMAARLPHPWIYHSDGDLTLILDDLLGLGMDGLHPIEPESMSLKHLKQRIGSRVCLVGNVSVDVLARGTAEQTRCEVHRCLSEGAPGGGYMISSSNSVPPYAIPANVIAMARAIRDDPLAVYATPGARRTAL